MNTDRTHLSCLYACVPDKDVDTPLEERAHGERHALKRANLARRQSVQAAAPLRTSPKAVGLCERLHARTRADVPHIQHATESDLQATANVTD